ncbi:MAG: PAS domain S-box protein [Nitrospinaceae bacterium]
MNTKYLPANKSSTGYFSNIWWASAAIILLGAVGWWGFNTVEKEMKKNLSEQLRTTLDTNIETLKVWIHDKKMDAKIVALNPGVRSNILSLTAKAKGNSGMADAFKSSAELHWLRSYLGSVSKTYGFVGFVIMDRTGLQVGALLEEPVGSRDLSQLSDFVERSLQGETVLSLPFTGEIDLPDEQGTRHASWPTMFVSTPVRDDHGKIGGVLAFRLHPEGEFSRILEISRAGETEETYAFDAQGLMISDSRFNAHLRKIGIIPNRPDSRAILHVHVRDPGGNLLKGYRPKLPRDQQPLTRMAASAVRKEPRIDVEGYRDYRGVPVVGAWTWLEEFGFGLTTEIDVSEAFAPLFAMRRLFLVIFTFLCTAMIIALVLRGRRLKSQRDRDRAVAGLKASEERFHSVFSNAMDGIVTIHQNGIIETLNPAAARIFGYRAGEIVGKNVSLLMPEPHRAAHDGYIQRYMFTGEARILGVAREVPGRRKDGSIFDLEISVSKADLGHGNIFIGIVRDITERKQAEKKLQDHARRQAAVSQLGQSALEGMELSDLMNKTVHLLQQTLNSDYCKILEYLPKEDSFILRAGVGWKTGLTGRERIPGGRNSQAGFTLLSNKPVVVWNMNRETRFSGVPLLRDHGVISGMSVVIRDGNQIFGVLGAHTGYQRKFTEDETHFLQSAANILATAIERKQSEERLRHYAGELERSNQDLEEFAFIASHDLQEPLRKVIIFGDRIKSCFPSQMDDSGNDYIGRLQKATSRMQDFINDLLQYSRITRKREPLEAISLDKTVEEVLSCLETRIKRSHATVEAGPLPTIEGGRIQVRQLMQNLISNALKYHKENESPRVRISARKNEKDTWDILVEDNGIGIDKKYYSRIFKPFERLHGRGQYDGSGIGLAICAKLVSRLGGSIRVESETGRGSIFILTLPATQPRESRPEVKPDTSSVMV